MRINILFILISILLITSIKKYTVCCYALVAFLLGFAWASWHAHSALSWSLPKEVEAIPIIIKGQIASLPVKEQWQTSFLFSLEQLGSKIQNTKPFIKLHWRENLSELKVGDTWQLQVKLKRIHGMQNPGGFDYEAWALQRGIRATGYVLKSKQNILLSQSIFTYPIQQLRQQLQWRIQDSLPNSKTASWLEALLLGEKHHITPESWQVLRNTGTNHLMAVGGLHIGLLAGFTHFLVAWLWRRVPYCCLTYPAQHAGACAALCAAGLYSTLAGFSIPTQRACVMLIVFICVLLSRHKINSWHSWSLALLCVLLINPLSVLTESFWLSFGTIALIIYGMSGRLSITGLWWKWGRVQCVIGIGLIPLTFFLFQECSLVSFFANTIAIPWLTFFILPFCFLGSISVLLSQNLASFFFLLADKSLMGLWLLLTWLSQLDFSTLYLAIPSVDILFLTTLGFILLLLPTGFPGRWIGMLWILPLVLHQQLKPNDGDVWMTLLDVGQGLSAVIRTQTHILVFDTGAKLGNIDMGELVVVPYLRTIGAKKINMLVISHGDNDHIGGADALLQYFSVKEIRTSVPQKFPLAAYCLAGQSWEWDGVKFNFLHPSSEQLNLGNNSSCVLQIDNGIQRILFTGDIEKLAENKLVTKLSNYLSANVLIAPHHGSKTSGIKAFIDAVHPQIVLFPIGYHNRYHFPHPTVVESYKRINAIQLNTADEGAIEIKLAKNKSVDIKKYRSLHHHYWYEANTMRD